MSKRSIHRKQANRMVKALRRKPSLARIDLVEWLMDRGHAQTRGQARKLLEEGRVTVQGKPVGRAHIGLADEDERFVATPVVDANLRHSLVVEDEAAVA